MLTVLKTLFHKSFTNITRLLQPQHKIVTQRKTASAINK